MKKGFTLIELLVVIAIVGILTTMSAALIVSVKQKRQTKAVAAQVQNIILEARAYAISPKTATGTGAVDIVIGVHSVAAKVAGTDILNSVTVSSKITLKCATGAATGTCFSFVTDDVNKMGQVKPGGKDIIATNSTGEKYTIKVSPLSGNVTVGTP